MKLSFEELKKNVAGEILSLHLEKINKVFDDLTTEERDLYLEDIYYHLDFLTQAI